MVDVQSYPNLTVYPLSNATSLFSAGSVSSLFRSRFQMSLPGSFPPFLDLRDGDSICRPSEPTSNLEVLRFDKGTAVIHPNLCSTYHPVHHSLSVCLSFPPPVYLRYHQIHPSPTTTHIPTIPHISTSTSTSHHQ